jgi:hypothetical protein
VTMRVLEGPWNWARGGDLQDVVEPPVADEICGPPSGRGFARGGGDDGVREVHLLPIHVKDRHVPGTDYSRHRFTHS